MNLNWGTWCSGLMSAIASGLMTALTAVIVLKVPPTSWEIFCIAVGPMALNFLGYIKQTPPPIGGGK